MRHTDNSDESSRPDALHASASRPSHTPATPYDHLAAPKPLEVAPSLLSTLEGQPGHAARLPRLFTARRRWAAVGGRRRRSRRRTSPAHSEHKHTSAKLASRRSGRRDVAHVDGRGGRTFASAVALAVEEGPPSPAARLGPIHWMGRAVRSKAHALSGHTMPAPMSSKSASAAISDRVQDHVQRAKHSSAW
jgi:hypothetical protein